MSYQSVSLCLHEGVGAIQRIEPEIKEEACKITPLQDETTRAQIFSVLGYNKVDIVALYMRKRLNDSVRHDGYVFPYQGFQTFAIKNMRFEGYAWVHDESMRAQVEEIS